jgi:hypothetical protein
MTQWYIETREALMNSCMKLEEMNFSLKLKQNLEQRKSKVVTITAILEYEPEVKHTESGNAPGFTDFFLVLVLDLTGRTLIVSAKS